MTVILPLCKEFIMSFDNGQYYYGGETVYKMELSYDINLV